MIKKLVVFGDSYMYGTELPQDDPDLYPKIENIVADLPRDPVSGAIPIGLLRSSHFDALWNLEMSTPDYEYRCHNYSIGGIIKRHLGLEVYNNYAWAGYSNEATMVELIKNRGLIDNETLVIVGITFPTRTTRLNEETGYNKIRTFNNFSSLSKNKDHEKFIELSFKYDNDIMTKCLQVINFISFVKRELNGIPHIIIDPVNIFRDNPDLNGMIVDGWILENTVKNYILKQGDNIFHPELVDYAQNFFNDNLFPFTFNHSISHAKQNGYYGRALLGHPSKKAQEHYASNYLIPYINKTYFS